MGDSPNQINLLISNSPAPPKLHVVLPALYGQEFPFFKKHISELIEHSARLADKNGEAKPCAILFAENSLSYIFSISSSKVARHIDEIQKMLPSDLWVAVAFSVLEKTERGPRNMGYLVGAEQEVKPCLKRIVTDYDRDLLKRAFPDKFSLDLSKTSPLERNWEYDGLELQAQGEEFSSLYVPSGLKIELRVCFDSTAKPLVYEENTVSLVPAYAFDISDAKDLSNSRKIVIINDGEKAIDAMYRKKVARATKQTACATKPSNTVYYARDHLEARHLPHTRPLPDDDVLIKATKLDELTLNSIYRKI